VEGHLHRARRRLTVALIAALAVGPTAGARADHADSSVTSDGDGVRVQIDRQRGAPGRSGGVARTAAVRPRPGPCRLRRVTTPMPVRFSRTVPAHPLTPFFVICAGRVTSIVWLDRSRGPTVAATNVTEQLVREIPLPVVSVRVSPDRRTVTGVETWFWADGYDGAPVTASIRELGTVIDVEATLTSVRWDFGDGTTTAADLGRAAPARSTITHVYERPGAVAISASLVFAVRFRIDGGPWTDLPAITRTAERSYPVIEARSQLQQS
jgi:hypothetical protein